MSSQQFCEEWTKNAETCKTQLRQESTRHRRRFNRVWASYLLGASCAEEAHSANLSASGLKRQDNHLMAIESARAAAAAFKHALEARFAIEGIDCLAWISEKSG
jgi:hypothetical protein